MSRGGGVSASTRASVGLQISRGPARSTTEVGTIGASANGLSCSRSRIAADCARFVRREVGLGQRHHGAAHAEVGEDLQMLLRLRHPPIVGGDNQQGEVDGADAGDHVLHEVFVARHVDNPETKRGR